MLEDRLLFHEKGRLGDCRKSACELISMLSLHHYFGFFETVLCLDSKPVLLDEHLTRLAGSCSEFSVSIPDTEKLRHEILDFLSHLPSERISVLKLTVLKAGDSSSLIHLSRRGYRYAEDKLAAGLRLAVAEAPVTYRSRLARHKSTHRFELELLRQDAASRGFDDALLIDSEGFVLETSRANVFVLMDGRWLTPHSKRGFLAGTVRNFLLAGGVGGFDFHESSLSVKDLFKAEEMVVTNSLIGVAPVVFLENGKRFKVERALELREALWNIFHKLSNY